MKSSARPSPGPVPAALIIDDGAPVNLSYFAARHKPHVCLIPNRFLQKYADLCAAFGVKGKFSVLPIPAGIGRLDERLNRVPAAHTRAFLKIVRQAVMPRFDITPELLTHMENWNIRSGGLGHFSEDEWVARAAMNEIADYLTLALQILKRVGLPATGVTSPWMTGNRNERDYAEAIGRAQWRVHRRKLTWYFLHCLGNTEPRAPWIARRDRANGQVVVSVPANANDFNGGLWGGAYGRQGRKAVIERIDTLLSADGRQGRIVDLLQRRIPVTLLTHWQLVFNDGHETGLWGLEQLLLRMRRLLGDRLRWTTCLGLAREAVRESDPG